MTGPTRVVRNPNFRPPNIKIPGKAIGMALLILLVGLAVLSSFFTVQPEEVGVVLRFGKYNREASPGVNFKLPSPIEEVEKVAVERQFKQEFGFRTQSARGQQRSQFSEEKDESSMLTGDLNVLEVSWITQYRIAKPRDFLFKVRNPEETFRDMNESVMRLVVGDRSVNEVLTVGRQEIASEMEHRLQELCNQYEMGIGIEQVVLQDVTPPDEVKPSFNEVNQAQQERERLINEALKDYNSIIPRAKGEAQQVIQTAEGYATDRVNRAEGDASLFKEVLAAYKRAPSVTRRRLYLETMTDVLPKIERKIIVDKDMKGILPLLNLEGK